MFMIANVRRRVMRLARRMRDVRLKISLPPIARIIYSGRGRGVQRILPLPTRVLPNVSQALMAGQPVAKTQGYLPRLDLPSAL